MTVDELVELADELERELSDFELSDFELSLELLELLDEVLALDPLELLELAELSLDELTLLVDELSDELALLSLLVDSLEALEPDWLLVEPSRVELLLSLLDVLGLLLLLDRLEPLEVLELCVD